MEEDIVLEPLVAELDVQALLDAVQSGNIMVILVVLIPLITLIAKAITIVTPTRSDNEIMDRWIYWILNLVALNFGKASNADDPDAVKVAKAAAKKRL